jgi:hypothetical protein
MSRKLDIIVDIHALFDETAESVEPIRLDCIDYALHHERLSGTVATVCRLYSLSSLGSSCPGGFIRGSFLFQGMHKSPVKVQAVDRTTYPIDSRNGRLLSAIATMVAM